MRRPKRQGGFLLSLLLTLLFNLEWTIPAWIFLALHFWKGISILWFICSILLWMLFVMLKLFVFGSLTRAGNYKDPPKVNKNPYSSKGYTKGEIKNEEN